MTGWRNRWEAVDSPELYYVLGVLKGDGSVSLFRRKDGYMAYRIRLDTKDKVFCESFREGLKKIGIKSNIWKRPRRGNAKPQYIAYCENGMFVYWYKDLTLKEIEKKLEKEEYAIAFLRGFYESEGSLYISGNRYRLSITNKDMDLLKLIEKLTKKFGFKPHIYTYNGAKSSWSTLRLHGKKEAERFVELINPCIRYAW